LNHINVQKAKISKTNEKENYIKGVDQVFVKIFFMNGWP